MTQARVITNRHQDRTQDHRLQINLGTLSHVERDLARLLLCRAGRLVITDHQDHIEKMACLHLEEDLAQEGEEDLLREVVTHREEALVREAHLRKVMVEAGIQTAKGVATRPQE